MTRPLRLLPLLLVLAACSRAPILEPKPEAGDVAAAKVGSETIWASDVRRAAMTAAAYPRWLSLKASFERIRDSDPDRDLRAAAAIGLQAWSSDVEK